MNMKKAFKCVWIDSRNRAWSVLHGNGFYGRATSDKFTQYPVWYPKDGKAAVPPMGQRPYLFAFDSIQNAEVFLAKEFGHYLPGEIPGHLEIWECEYVPYRGLTPVVKAEHERDKYILGIQPHGTIFASTITLTKKVGRIR